MMFFNKSIALFCHVTRFNECLPVKNEKVGKVRVMEEKFDEIEQKVKELIERILKVKGKGTEIKRESTLADLGGDSLSALSILSALEQEFNISISDEEIVDIGNFSGAVKVVKKYVKDYR